MHSFDPLRPPALPSNAQATGNHLNTSAGKGASSGFHLTSKTGNNTLIELTLVKGVKNKRLSLLHYVVLQVTRSFPGCLETLLADLEPVKKASQVQMTAPRSWLEELGTGLRGVQGELRALQDLRAKYAEDPTSEFLNFCVCVPSSVRVVERVRERESK